MLFEACLVIVVNCNSLHKKKKRGRNVKKDSFIC